ncbi:MAG: hypothetical protein K9M01_04655, partial [Candidatus Omnitrophica bacterium]|nr:hypothetical protein [Candidatus Omnitrophota bacterium]
MKKLILVLTALVFLAISTPVFSAEGGKKGASSKAQEQASQRSIFNRVGDWFATVGKSKEEKKKILNERKQKKTQEKTAKKTEKMQKKAEVEAEQAREKAAEKAKEKAKKMEEKEKGQSMK